MAQISNETGVEGGQADTILTGVVLLISRRRRVMQRAERPGS
jgi:hypothetical protein